MKFSRLFLGSVTVFALLTPYCGVEACGPFFDPDRFVFDAHPDDLQSYARGHLGILQHGFDSNELAVAYRYLNGGQLSAAELAVYAAEPKKAEESGDEPYSVTMQRVWQDRMSQDSGADPQVVWSKLRLLYNPAAGNVAGSSAPRIDTSAYAVLVALIERNCSGSAYATASEMLKARAATWGQNSPWLADWLRGQDVVFSSCANGRGDLPADAPGNAPQLLKADRAYQRAAAEFYGGRYGEALAGFEAIAADNSSPWQPWGKFLAARTCVRIAFSMGKPTDAYSGDLASFDLKTMQQAEQMLEAIHPVAGTGPSAAAVQSELNLVRMRASPERRLADLSAAMAGPKGDTNFRQDLADLNFALIKGLGAKSESPLLKWIFAWRGGGSKDSYAAWQKTHTLPWLVVALAKASEKDSYAPELVAEAAKIEPGTPAYETALYYRTRLLVGLKRDAEARELLDTVLARPGFQKTSSTRNSLREMRMLAAKDLDDVLSFAQRTMLTKDSPTYWTLREKCPAVPAGQPAPHCKVDDLTAGFDRDFVTALHQELPLSVWLVAAQRAALAPELRQNLAMAGWVRAVVLEDDERARSFQPLLPVGLGVKAEGATGFPAVLTILRNWGLRPYLEPGIARVESYGSFGEYRDNWWDDHSDRVVSSEGELMAVTAPDLSRVLTPEQKAAKAAEMEKMKGVGNSTVTLGRRVLEYAKAHPEDPNVAEALALVVRCGHYSTGSWRNQEADGKTATATSKLAFQLLHSKYPKSGWARKTKVYY